MMGPLILRPARSDDDAHILDLYGSAFMRQLDPDRWTWLNYTSPGGPSRTSVIEDTETDMLVGTYSLLPIKIRFNGRETKASLAINAGIHPNYQKQGLFVRLSRYILGRECEFNTPISLGMPNQNAYPGHMKVGWDVMCKLPFLVKHNCQPSQHRCREVECFDERFDDFFSEIAERFSFIVLKDHQVMNWRLVDQPQREYTIFILEEGLNLRGYIVLKHFDDKMYRKSHILDIQAKTSEALGELIKAAESFAHGRDELNMWSNVNNPYHQAFLKNGFYERESQDLLIIRFNYGSKEPLAEGGWWFCLADNDVY